MWIERRMTSGPGQTKAGAASCPLDAIGEDRPLSLVRTSCEHRRARRPPASSNPSGHHLRSGADVIRRPNVSKSPDQDETAVGENRPNEPGSVAPRPSEGRRRPDHGPSRSVPRDGRIPAGLRPRMGGGTPRAIARIEVRAIGSAMWLVRCLLSPWTAKGSRRRRWWSRDHQGRGSPCREAPAISDLECWRDPTEREVRMSLPVGSHSYPTASRPKIEDLNCTKTCTKRDVSHHETKRRSN